jgi:hypothetical protein
MTSRKSKPRLKTDLDLMPGTRAALRRIKKTHGINYTRAIERGVALLETHLQQMPPV